MRLETAVPAERREGEDLDGKRPGPVAEAFRPASRTRRQRSRAGLGSLAAPSVLARARQVAEALAFLDQPFD